MTKPNTRNFFFDVTTLNDERKEADTLYHEFLRVPDMSAGLYVLPAGGTDPQQPHQEDEMYYVIQGRGKFTSGDEVVDVASGSILYVPKHVPHRFHDITEELMIVVFFAPAES